MYFNTLFLTFLVLFNLQCRTSKNSISNSKIEIIQEFEIGKTYNYKIQKSREEPIGNTQLLGLPVLNVSLEIASLNDSSNICSWNYGNLTIPQDNTKPYNEEIETIFNGISLKFTVNLKGTFKELTNYEDAVIGLETMFLKRGRLTNVDFDEDNYKETIEAISFTYKTPDLLLSSHFEELPIFFSLFGEIIDMESINIDSLEMPEGISNEHQKGIALTWIKEINHPTIQIIQKRIFQKETLNEFIKFALENLPNNVDKIKELESLEDGGVTIQINYIYNYVDKIMTKVESIKTVNYYQRKMQKTSVISLVI